MSHLSFTRLADRLLAAVDDGSMYSMYVLNVSVYLWIIMGNHRAEAFYRRRGFELLPEIFETGEDWGGAQMRRMLRAWPVIVTMILVGHGAGKVLRVASRFLLLGCRSEAQYV